MNGQKPNLNYNYDCRLAYLFHFNLAVIRVEPAIKFSKTVTPVNLPPCKQPPGIGMVAPLFKTLCLLYSV